MVRPARPRFSARRATQNAWKSTIERRMYVMKGWVRNSVAPAVFAAIAIGGAVSALADDSVNTGYFGGVAIMGYDTVAYFTEGKAVKGSDEFSYEWLGTPWHFASKKHQEMFISAPVKYAPQYGGYCAAEVAGSGSVTVN